MNSPSSAIRLLLIEDNPGDVRLIEEALRESRTDFGVTVAGRLEDGLRLLKEAVFDTILLDLNLPDSQGISSISRLFIQVPEIPIIVLTGVQDEAIGMEAISAGAQDYLVKGHFNPELLSRSIQYAGQRKKIEKALHESEARYKKLFDSSLDCIFRVDEKGVVVMVNRAGAEMFGFQSPEEALGTSGLELWADRGERLKFFDIIRRQKVLRAYPIKARKKTGETIYLEVSSQLLEDEQGKPIGIEGILRDITDRKTLEEQLLQSQKIEAIGTLAGGVAHDFNNILTAIMGYTHVVLSKLKQDDPLHYELQQVLTAADRAAMLTQSLLAFSRKQMIRLAPVEVNDLIRKFGAFLSRLIREDIEINTAITDERLIVMADKSQIEQALMNLATNAQDAMPSGGRLSIECRRYHMTEAFIASNGYGVPGEYALICVSDTGIGMDETTKRKIFEPFFTTKEVGKGTGLGLALVYGTIKKHEGYITVSSEPGRGSIFKIYLPLTDNTPEEPARPPNLSSAYAGGAETVLVAEDDEALRVFAAAVLANAGYTVIEAADGLEAIQKFLEHQDSIRLALLDVIMPKKNGQEVYKEITVLSPELKVIFMSGYTEGVLDSSDMQGMQVPFLQKPVSPEELLKKVRSELDARKKT